LTALATTTPGTGVGTALAVNTGTAGAFVVNGGALGTPSSGTLTNAAGLPLSTGVTGQLPLANGGTGANLTDPNADRLMFWDESASAVAFLTPGTGLTITGTTIDASASITGFTAAESTASPNATVSVASLTANNAATNVDAALCPKGTGAVLADVPDSTATGGNKRGASAVDWQTVRSTAAQVASGTKATVAGGENNTASGTQSVVGGGNGNTAVGITATVAGGGANWARSNNSTVGGGSSNDVTGVNATVAGGSSNNTTANYATVAGGELNTGSGAYSWSPGGWNSTTRGIHGAGAYAAGKRSAQGDRQTMVLPISCAARTDATATVMTSDAGVASATNQMVLPNNSSMFFEVDVVAHDTTLKSASWKVQGTIRRGANAAATAIVGTNVTTTFGSDLSGGSPGVTCTADTTNGALQVTFTGIAATTIYPSGHIRTVIAA